MLWVNMEMTTNWRLLSYRLTKISKLKYVCHTLKIYSRTFKRDLTIPQKASIRYLFLIMLSYLESLGNAFSVWWILIRMAIWINESFLLAFLGCTALTLMRRPTSSLRFTILTAMALLPRTTCQQSLHLFPSLTFQHSADSKKASSHKKVAVSTTLSKELKLLKRWTIFLKYVLRGSNELILQLSSRWMRRYPAILCWQFLVSSESDYHVLKTFGGINAITTYTWRWFKTSRIWTWMLKVWVELPWCQAKVVWRESHPQKWDMSVHCHLIRSGKQREKKAFKVKDSHFCRNMLRILDKHLHKSKAKWFLAHLIWCNKTPWILKFSSQINANNNNRLLTRSLKTKSCWIKTLINRELSFSRNLRKSSSYKQWRNNRKSSRVMIRSNKWTWTFQFLIQTSLWIQICLNKLRNLVRMTMEMQPWMKILHATLFQYSTLRATT